MRDKVAASFTILEVTTVNDLGAGTTWNIAYSKSSLTSSDSSNVDIRNVLGLHLNAPLKKTLVWTTPQASSASINFCTATPVTRSPSLSTAFRTNFPTILWAPIRRTKSNFAGRGFPEEFESIFGCSLSHSAHVLSLTSFIWSATSPVCSPRLRGRQSSLFKLASTLLEPRSRPLLRTFGVYTCLVDSYSRLRVRDGHHFSKIFQLLELHFHQSR